MYLFHRIEQRLDGTPAIIVVDEGWKALDDDVFVRRIKDWEKTIRKRNGLVGFCTQNADDALDSRIGPARSSSSPPPRSSSPTPRRARPTMSKASAFPSTSSTWSAPCPTRRAAS